MIFCCVVLELNKSTSLLQLWVHHRFSNVIRKETETVRGAGDSKCCILILGSFCVYFHMKWYFRQVLCLVWYQMTALPPNRSYFISHPVRQDTQTFSSEMARLYPLVILGTDRFGMPTKGKSTGRHPPMHNHLGQNTIYESRLLQSSTGRIQTNYSARWKSVRRRTIASSWTK